MVASAEQIKGQSNVHPAATKLVLVVAASESVAKRIESYLRNAGHPIRCAWLTDLEDTEEALRGGGADLLICAENFAPAPVRDVIDLCKRLAPDMPMLVLNPQFTPEETVAALAAGARDHVSDEDLRHLRHLELVVLREFANHQALRDLRGTRQRLEDFESRHQQLVAGTNDAVAHIQEGIIATVNPAFAQLLGHKNPDDLIGLPLMDLVVSDHQPKVKDHLKLLQRGRNDGKSLECCLQHQDGRRVSINARLTLGQIDGEQLVEMLIRSEAPGGGSGGNAPSTNGRLAFFESLAAAIAGAGQQKGQRAAMLFVIDEFDGVEGRIGLHDAEQAVEQCIEWLQQRLSPHDHLFRFSTGEIAAIVTRPNALDIQQFGELIVTEVAKQVFNTSGHEAHLSMTVAAYPFTGSEDAAALAAELVRDARRLSEKSGGNQFANLGPTAESSIQEREDARKASMVKKALEDGRLKLAYQSIASLEGDTRQHFDVLVRVIDENGKEMHASEFIGAAEKFGLMRAIDRWVTSRAFKVQAKRDSADEPSSLFLKISQDTLKDADAFVAWITEQIKERAIKPGEIVFEFREEVVQSHVRKAKMLTKALSDLGAQIAIEHFGLGSNSAQMIDHIPMQFLKFHPKFTSQFNDKDIHSKMNDLMDKAKHKNIKIIVSHVEDANVMARLWQMGVNFIQGYHVQEPEVVLLSADVR